MANGRVPVQDDPYAQLIANNGFKIGDKVKFFAEREGEGVLEKRGGSFVVKDSKGNPWGLAGILRNEGGFIERI